MFDWLKNWRFVERTTLVSLHSEIINLKEQVRAEQAHTKTLLNTIVTLKKKANEKKEDFDLEKYWNEKYPRASITYRGRSLPFSNTEIKTPVNVLITPTDPEIRRDLISWGLYKSGESHETLIPKIYAKIYEKYYKYEFDRPVWGRDEVWEMPFEMRAKGFSQGFDCDSWGIFQCSYYLCAGVPDWKVRCVAGDTSMGGHLTVYVFSLTSKSWHHLNSTYGLSFQRVFDFPTHADAREGLDLIGISKVWFSFTRESAFTSFEDDLEFKELLILQEATSIKKGRFKQ